MALTPSSTSQAPGNTPAFWQYDPSKVIAVYKGLTLSGFADGTFLEIERTRPMWELYVGTTGSVARCRTRNDTAKVTATILADAPICDLLIAAAIDDAGSWPTGGDWQGVKPLRIKDINGTLKVDAIEAWIAGIPKITRARQSDVMVWEFLLADINYVVDLT